MQQFYSTCKISVFASDDLKELELSWEDAKHEKKEDEEAPIMGKLQVIIFSSFT